MSLSLTEMNSCLFKLSCDYNVISLELNSLGPCQVQGETWNKNPSCVYVLHKTSHKEISSRSDAVGSLRGNLLTGCYVCLSRCTIEISRSSRAAGSPLWSLIMSVMSGKKERRIINLQYQNENILTERVTDVFLRSPKMKVAWAMLRGLITGGQFILYYFSRKRLDWKQCMLGWCVNLSSLVRMTTQTINILILLLWKPRS